MISLLQRCFSRLFGFSETETKTKIALVGLDSVGKTSLLYNLGLQLVVDSVPPRQVRVESCTCGGVQIVSWDIGGSDPGAFKGTWNVLAEDCEAIIWMLDGTDRLRIYAARRYLQELLSAAPPGPLLVFVNKSDAPGAMDLSEVTDALEEVQQLCEGGAHGEYNVIMCCVLTMEGIEDGIRWLEAACARRR